MTPAPPGDGYSAVVSAATLYLAPALRLNQRSDPHKARRDQPRTALARPVFLAGAWLGRQKAGTRHRLLTLHCWRSSRQVG
jgi:hypothetical protein